MIELIEVFIAIFNQLILLLIVMSIIANSIIFII